MKLRTAFPEWTEYRAKNGLDPLGMQNSSVSLYQFLLPGISNVTNRIRYYGLYAWLSQKYAKTIGDQNPKTWQRIVRRSEALYALVSQSCGNESGVGGVTWAGKTLDSSEQVVDFIDASEPGSKKYYLKQKWGVYGAAYASQLYEIGIFGEAREHEIPIPTPNTGILLAEAFESAGSELANKFFGIVQRGNVSRAELKELSPLTPSGIIDGSDECNCYRDILFAHLGLQRTNDVHRRHTLMLILLVAKQLKRIPKPDEVRWMLYQNIDSDGRELNYNSSALFDQRIRWWIYQANDLTHIAYEMLLKYSLDLLEQYPAGVTLDGLINEMTNSIRSSVKEWPTSWDQHLNQHASDKVDAELVLCSSIIREGKKDGIIGPSEAWNALTLLATVFERAKGYKQQIESELASRGTSVSRSLLTELNYSSANRAMKFDDFLFRLIKQRVIKRHLWIAMGKLRFHKDYTFLIESDDGIVRLRAKDGPVYTNPRLGPAIAFLKDVYLINENGLTEDGETMLERR